MYLASISKCPLCWPCEIILRVKRVPNPNPQEIRMGALIMFKKMLLNASTARLEMT